MKTLTLDKSKWRCGGKTNNSANKLGKGPTKLLNEEGFMCCLGQFALQLGATEDMIRGRAIPAHIHISLEGLNVFTDYATHNPDERNDGCWDDTQLSCEAMKINDDIVTTVEDKISNLKVLFLKHGYEINVI